MGQMFTPANIMRIIWRRLPVMLLVLIIGLPLVVWYAISQPKVYEAQSIIQIETPQVVGPTTGTTVPGAPSQIDLIQQQLTSRDSLLAAINELGLFDGAGEMSDSEKVGQLREAMQIVKLIDPAQAFNPNVQPSGLIITVRLGDPEQAADTANYFLNAILTEAEVRADETAADTLAFFQSQVARVQANINEVEDEIALFKEANAGSLPTEQTAQQDRLTELNQQMLAIDQQIIELQTNSDRVREEELARQLTLLDQQRARYETDANEIRAAIAAAPAVERELSGLERELDQLESELETITTERTQAEIRDQLESRDQAARYQVLETAIVPEFSISTSRTKLAVAGGLFVGFCALAIGILVEILNPVIRNAAQLEAQLGIQPVITVPHLRRPGSNGRTIVGMLAILAGFLAVIAWVFLGLRELVLGPA